MSSYIIDKPYLPMCKYITAEGTLGTNITMHVVPKKHSLEKFGCLEILTESNMNEEMYVSTLR